MKKEKIISISFLLVGIFTFISIKLLYPSKDSSGMPLIIPNYIMLLYILAILFFLIGLITLILKKK